MPINKTYGQLYGPVVEAKDSATMNAAFDTAVDHYLASHLTEDRKSVRIRLKADVHYYAGYYSDVAKRNVYNWIAV